MSQTQNPNLPPEDCYDDDEINLIDLIYPIFKRRKFLIIFCFVITFFVGIISVFSEKIYEARAVILPETSDEGGDIGVKAAFLEQFGVAGLGGSNSTPSAVFGAVLKSNELAWDVLNRYDYYNIMGVSNYNQKNNMAKAFAEKVNVSESKKDPSISVSLQYDDPMIVSDIANAYVKALDKYNLENSYTSTSRLREYIENRLSVAEEELDSAHKELREFQEKNKAVSISKQTEATLELLAEMESQKVALEVEKAAKEKSYGEPAREIEQLEAQIEAINKNIDRLTNSENASVPIEVENGNVEFYIPLTRIPALNYDESKLLLRVKAKTGVITMLTTQLEQTKLDEAKDMPTINTLEIAEPPQNAVKPKKILNVILGFFASLFLGIFIIFIGEVSQKMEKNAESGQKWLEIKKDFLQFIPFNRTHK